MNQETPAKKGNAMPSTQWPSHFRIHAVREDFLENPHVAFYAERGLAGLAEMRVYQRVAQVMAAHDSKSTASPIAPSPTPNKRDNLMNASTLYPAGRPVRLPAKLDAAACLAILQRIDPEVKVDSIAAARDTLTVERLDRALEYIELSVEDRFRLKSSVAEFGILARGVRTSIRAL
jgi:hypothetical protein